MLHRDGLQLQQARETKETGCSMSKVVFVEAIGHSRRVAIDVRRFDALRPVPLALAWLEPGAKATVPA